MTKPLDEKNKIRHEYGCVNDHDLIKLKRYKKFYVDLCVLGETLTRKMAKVPLRNKKTAEVEDWYVDCITGTMYHCKTRRGNSPFIQVQRVSNKPVSNEPVSNKPVSNEPVSNEPVSNKPVSNEPVSNEP